MIYILMIWTVVSHAGMNHSTSTKMDWRPVGEFQKETGMSGPVGKTAQQMCEDAARQLGLKTDAYRCVRSK